MKQRVDDDPERAGRRGALCFRRTAAAVAPE